MKLNEFKSLLKAQTGKQFRIQLPDGSPVPMSFHVTEVGRVQKTFIDCGGTLRDTVTCQLQVWVGEDEDHRLEAGKTAAILEKARSFLPDDSVPLEIEYEDEVISQYTIEGHEVGDGAVVLHLAHKHTDCLAREVCGVSSTTKDATATGAAACCGTSGCC
jgi:hypothetical protein